MPAHIVSLSSYPIKGLSALNHERVAVVAGEGFPGDRIFGFAKGNSGFDLPKSRFLALYGYEALARLDTAIDPNTLYMRITEREGANHYFDLSRAEGEAKATAFLNTLLALDADEYPVFATAAPHRFTDVSVTSTQMMHAISLINLASVRAFGEAIGAERASLR